MFFKLAADHDFPVPPTMVEAEFQQIWHQLQQEAAANAQASLKAYQSGVTEFTGLMRARITDLDVRLEALRIRVDRARAQANLLYLAGDPS